MPKVKISDSKGLVEELGSGLTVESTSTFSGVTNIDGKLVANSVENDICRVMQLAIGSNKSLDTGAVTTVTDAIVQPGNTVLIAVGMLCTREFQTGTPNDMGLNVGTDSDGTGEQIVALDTDAIYSNHVAGFANGAMITSFNGGPSGEAGSPAVGAGISLVPNAAVFTSENRSLYFRTTSSGGINPTQGRFKPVLFYVRIT